MENPEKFIVSAEHSEEGKKKELSPQKLYEKGKEPLDIKFDFSNGEQLTANQNEDGTANIELKRGDEKIIDFKDWLGEGYKFVTPSFLRKEKVKLPPVWTTGLEAKFVNIGHWDSPKKLVALLHEIGHSHQNFENFIELRKPKENGEKETPETALAAMREVSSLERNAWAFALQKVRELKKDGGIDVVGDVFGNLAELKKYVIWCLSKYTESILTVIKSTDSNKQLEEELGKLFDKGLREKE